jgi:hypothetical protein
MKIESIKDICTGLTERAHADKFLERSVDDIEGGANKFVEKFATDNGLTAHTLSAFRWYFQSDSHLLEDGFVELRCKANLLHHDGACTFDVVDIGEIDRVKHA